MALPTIHPCVTPAFAANAVQTFWYVRFSNRSQARTTNPVVLAIAKLIP